MKIIIIGVKGTAIDVGEQIVNAREQFNSPVELLGWAGDDETLGPEINNYPVLCKPRELVDKFDDPDIKLIFCLYKANKMEERVNLLSSYGIAPSRFTNFIHPTAYVAKSVTMGVGNAILSHTSVFSNVRMGDYNIFYSGSIIGHDTQIGKSNFFATADVGSECIIGNGIFMGMNCTIKTGLYIDDYAFVGMGANVLRNVETRLVVFGNPARSKQ